jgi:hypothetical protein
MSSNALHLCLWDKSAFSTSKQPKSMPCMDTETLRALVTVLRNAAKNDNIFKPELQVESLLIRPGFVLSLSRALTLSDASQVLSLRALRLLCELGSVADVSTILHAGKIIPTILRICNMRLGDEHWDGLTDAIGLLHAIVSCSFSHHLVRFGLLRFLPEWAMRAHTSAALTPVLALFLAVIMDLSDINFFASEQDVADVGSLLKFSIWLENVAMIEDSLRSSRNAVKAAIRGVREIEETLPPVAGSASAVTCLSLIAAPHRPCGGTTLPRPA